MGGESSGIAYYKNSIFSTEVMKRQRAENEFPRFGGEAPIPDVSLMKGDLGKVPASFYGNGQGGGIRIDCIDSDRNATLAAPENQFPRKISLAGGQIQNSEMGCSWMAFRKP